MSYITFSKNNLYMFMLSVLLIVADLDETELSSFIFGYTIIKDLSLILCFLVFFVVIFMNTSLKHLIFIILFLILSSIVGVKSGNIYVPVTVSAILAARHVPYLRIVKYFFIIDLLSMLFVITLSFFKIIPNNQFIKDGLIRNSLGFYYPLSLSAFVFILCVLFCIYKYYDISWIDIFVISISSIIVYFITRVQVYFVCALCLIFILLILKIHKVVLLKFPFSLSWLSLIFMTVITFYFDINYNPSNTFYYNFNKLLDNRLAMSNYALDNFHLSFLGRYVKENSNNGNISGVRSGVLNSSYFYVDQSMVRLLLFFGIILFVFMIIFYTYKMLKLYINHLNFLVILFAIIVAGGFIDEKFLKICYNPLLLILFANLDSFYDIDKKITVRK